LVVGVFSLYACTATFLKIDLIPQIGAVSAAFGINQAAILRKSGRSLPSGTHRERL
jgi:hypothetical protein